MLQKYKIKMNKKSLFNKIWNHKKKVQTNKIVLYLFLINLIKIIKKVQKGKYYNLLLIQKKTLFIPVLLYSILITRVLYKGN